MKQDMTGKLCIVTGANAGIGLMTAHALAKMGAHVVMVCRNEAKGKAAQAEIKSETGNEKVDLLRCDFSKQEDIRQCAAQILTAYPQIHVLVNNAGAVFAERQNTPEGIEMTFAVNHLGYFLLTRLLLDRLKASAPARIVNVSSGSHYKGKIDFEDLHFERRKYHIMRAYEQSKLGNVLFTYELARRLADCGVTANCLHPGVVRTNIGNKSGKWVFAMLWSMLKPFMINSAKGAATSVHVATASELEGVTGKYFDNCKEKRSAEASYNEETAKRLWDESSQLVGLES